MNVTGKFVRTEEEIVSRVKDANEEMIFGVFRQEVLIPYLSYAYAKAHIREGVTESEWKDVEQPRTFEAVRQEIAEYLPFALDKARNARGLTGSVLTSLPLGKLPKANKRKFDGDWKSLPSTRQLLALAIRAFGGLSAARSIVKMKSWLWLIGEDKFLDAFDESTDYGEAALIAIGKKFNIPTAMPTGRDIHGAP